MTSFAKTVSRAPRLPERSTLILAALVVATGIVLEPTRGWAGLLTAAVYGLTLALGGAVFIAVHVLGGARWWDSLRGTCLSLARALPVPAVALLIVVTLGLTSLYRWSDHEIMEHDHLLHQKATWLNAPFFMARAIAVVCSWFLVIRWLGRRLEDVLANPSAGARFRLARASVVSVLVLAITISVGFWDWTMSLEPEWFSTMYGVYGIAAVLQGGIAAVTAVALMRARRSGTALPAELRHDLGKLLFAFSMFWAYIWFCQFMLIWYANLPEETLYFATRFDGGWEMLFWLNPILCFVVPFGLLLSARVKRREAALFQVAVIVLVGRWLDTYLLVGPAVDTRAHLPIYAVGATVLLVIAMSRWPASILSSTAGARRPRPDLGHGPAEVP